MPQSHPTTGPVRFLSPVRFLARKAEWSARRNFTSVLFPWSHQATGPVRLAASAYLGFGWIIRRTSRVPRAMPVWATYGPRTGIFNVFHIPRDPYGAVRDPQGCQMAPLRKCKGIYTTVIRKNPARTSYLAARAPHGPRKGCSWSVYNPKTRTGPVSLKCMHQNSTSPVRGSKIRNIYRPLLQYI